MSKLPEFLATPQPRPQSELSSEVRRGTFPAARFQAKIGYTALTPTGGFTDGCWEWNGARHPSGYGVFWMNGKSHQAHRVAWEFKYGPIPDGLILLHKCDNPPCVRVDPAGPVELDHFFIGTPAENNTDRDRKARGVALIGSANGNVKLDAEIVREIRALREGGFTYGQIAFRYNISAVTASRICNRITWSHID